MKSSPLFFFFFSSHSFFLFFSSFSLSFFWFPFIVKGNFTFFLSFFLFFLSFFLSTHLFSFPLLPIYFYFYDDRPPSRHSTSLSCAVVVSGLLHFSSWLSHNSKWSPPPQHPFYSIQSRLLQLLPNMPFLLASNLTQNDNFKRKLSSQMAKVLGHHPTPLCYVWPCFLSNQLRPIPVDSYLVVGGWGEVVFRSTIV